VKLIQRVCVDANPLQVSGVANWHCTSSPQPYIEHLADQKEQLVYLTADSSEVMQEVDPSKIYIIGVWLDVAEAWQRRGPAEAGPPGGRAVRCGGRCGRRLGAPFDAGAGCRVQGAGCRGRGRGSLPAAPLREDLVAANAQPSASAAR
jgi:hypothetical protein